MQEKMKLLYVITILAIYVLFILIRKTDKKQNIVLWMAVSVIMVICYNVFICVICTFIKVTCTLQNLSICNTIATILLLTFLIINKKIQKYYIKILDIIFMIVTLILVVLIAYKNYQFPFNIKYKTTDGGSHFYFADKFYETSTLLYKQDANEMLGVHNYSFRLPGAYVNEGILFRIFDGIVSRTDLFIIFDLIVLYMSGILMYFILKANAKENKKLCVLSAIFAILYMMSYQLNSMLYGYVYLSLALDIIITFILVISNYEKEQISNKIALPILSLLSFGIFFSYAYFVPIIYIAVIINIIIKSIRKKEKIISTENIINVLMTIINPLILGATYFIILPLTMGMKTEVSSISVDGTIYKNYITNFLPFIPILITQIVLLIKNKNKEKKLPHYETILFILSILFAIVLFIGNRIGKVSQYYFFKAYYIIWPLAIINTYIALNKILETKHKVLRIITYIYVCTYILLILISTLVFKKNILINDIFNTNIEYTIKNVSVLKHEELKILDNVMGKVKNNEIYIVTPDTYSRTRWLAVLHKNEMIFAEHKYWEKLTIEKWLEQTERKYYLAYYRDYNKIEPEQTMPDENNDEYKIIYNDEYGFILERK